MTTTTIERAHETQRRRERRADGVYEVVLGVISEQRVPNASRAVELTEATLRERADEIFARRGTFNATSLLTELAVAVVDRLVADNLIAEG